MSEEELYLIQLELARATPEEAELILDRLIAEGRITQEQLNGLVDWYVENVGVGEEEVSPVVQRERQIALDESIEKVLRDPDVPMEDKATIRGPEGQKLAEAYLKGESDDIMTVVKQMLGRAKSYRTEFRATRETALSRAWEQLSKQPLAAPYLKDITKTEIEDYVSGKSDDLLDKLRGIPEEANLAQRAQVKEAQEAQRAEAIFAGMEELGKPPPKEEFVRPTIPGTEKITKGFLEETGLAKGTKLRSFIASEIPGILEETRASREAWWRRMHPEPVAEEDVLGGRARLQEEARRWAGLAWGRRAAPEAEVSGGVYYGEGGLRGVAERAYRHAVETLGERQTEQEAARAEYEKYGGDEPGRRVSREDPLIAALRARKFRPEYYRQAGAGLRRALTPAVRY